MYTVKKDVNPVGGSLLSRTDIERTRRYELKMSCFISLILRDPQGLESYSV